MPVSQHAGENKDELPGGLVFEELELGRSYWTAPAILTREAIVAYACEWDPEPFHVDEKAASHSIFGELVASGWHTLVLSYLLFKSDGLMRGTVVAGLGVDDLRFRRPVRPGESLRVRYEIATLRPTSRHEHGLIGVRIETWNDRSEVVLDYLLKMLVKRKRTVQASA